MIDKIKNFKQWQWVLHATVLIGLCIAGIKYVNGDELSEALKNFRWIYAPFIVALTVVYMVIKGWRLSIPLSRIKSVNPWLVMRAYFASYGATLMPGGVGVLAAMLGQAGVPLGRSAAGR